MTESYKVKSKIATAVSFIAAFIVYVGKDALAQVLPEGLAYLAPIIVLFAGYIVTQTTENTRVATAEQLIHEEYANQSSDEGNVVVNLTLDGEDIITEDAGEEIINDDDDDDVA